MIFSTRKSSGIFVRRTFIPSLFWERNRTRFRIFHILYMSPLRVVFGTFPSFPHDLHLKSQLCSSWSSLICTPCLCSCVFRRLRYVGKVEMSGVTYHHFSSSVILLLAIAEFGRGKLYRSPSLILILMLEFTQVERCSSPFYSFLLLDLVLCIAKKRALSISIRSEQECRCNVMYFRCNSDHRKETNVYVELRIVHMKA